MLTLQQSKPTAQHPWRLMNRCVTKANLRDKDNAWRTDKGELILRGLCALYGIDRTVLTGRSKAGQLPAIRSRAMYLLFEQTGCYYKTGEYMKRDRTSVSVSVRRTTELLSIYEEDRNELARVKQFLATW